MSLADSGRLTPGRRRFSPRQEEVLDVVTRVFLREGFGGVRMGSLASEAGCSRSTLYDLAPSKEDLLLLVVDRRMRRIAKHAADEIARTDDPVQRVRAMLTTNARDLAELGPRFLDAVRGHPPARLLFDRWIAIARDVLERMLDDGVRAGRFRPVTSPVVADAMFAVVLRFTDPEFARSTRVSSADGLAELVDVLMDGLCPR